MPSQQFVKIGVLGHEDERVLPCGLQDHKIGCVLQIVVTDVRVSMPASCSNCATRCERLESKRNFKLHH